MNFRDFNDNWLMKNKDEVFTPIMLPHDAMIDEQRNPNAPSGSAGAYFSGGIYEYKKTFFVTDEWKEKSQSFLFEGVYKNAKVYINGEVAGGCAYGYSSFVVSAKDRLIYNAENEMTVIAENNDQPNSRWYTGSGIYRPVWLVTSNKEHIDIYGVKITTLSLNPAKVQVETKHKGGDSVKVEILFKGDLVASSDGDHIELIVPDARMWSDASPDLYQCKVLLYKDGIVGDEVTESFGIRKIEWSNKGLFINGKSTLLRGGCIHHDNGILGAAGFEESEKRRIRILKEAGFNALRVSHNPASKAFLSACDQYGIYVIDETWDMWYKRKSKNDYANVFEENYEFDIESMVHKDYNHPSVIMYSIGNEVSEPAEKKGVDLTERLVQLFHGLDKSRPVTAGINLMIVKNAAKGKQMYKDDGGLSGGNKDMGGMNSTMFNMITSMVGTRMNKMANSKQADAATSPCLDLLDIAGYNYTSGRYAIDGKLHPDRIIVGSETFPQDIVKNWEMVKKYPYLIGDFMWTAWDYLGECGLGAWAYTDDGKGFDKPYPWLLADSGVFDILGNPTGEIFLAQAAWGLLDRPVISVQPVNHPDKKPAKAVWRGTNSIPSWSWRNCEGNEATVEVYSKDHSVKLFLNEKCVGKKRIKNCKAVFKITYERGSLVAITYDKAKRETKRTELNSAYGKTSISIEPEKCEVSAGGIIYVNINLKGENGEIERNADRKLSICVENGELIAFGSANPRTEDCYTSGSFTTYYGCSQAVIRTIGLGNIRVKVTGDGLEDSETVIIGR